jgi:hypothetical protein
MSSTMPSAKYSCSVIEDDIELLNRFMPNITILP